MRYAQSTHLLTYVQPAISKPRNRGNVELRIPKRPHGLIINIRNPPTLHALIRPPPAILVTFIVQIVLQILIDQRAIALREPALDLVVAVSEVVAFAAVEEIKALGTVRRFGAAVVGPVEIAGLEGGFRGEEIGHRGVEEEGVGDGIDVAAGDCGDGSSDAGEDGEGEDEDDENGVHLPDGSEEIDTV